MGTISDKLSYLNTTKTEIKDAINLMGTNITNDTFRSYPSKIKSGLLDIMNNGIETTWNNWEKVTGTGENITLNNVVQAPMKIDTQGNTIQDGTPSPESEVPINSVGDNENLFDKANANILDGYYITSSKIDTSVGTKMLYIPIEPSKTYTVSKILSARFSIATTETVPERNTEVIDYQSNNSVTSLTLTASANANYLCVYYLHPSDTKTEQEILDSIKIEQGTQATPYSPYNMGSIQIEKCNKNIYNSLGTYTFTSVNSTWYFIDGKTGAYGSDIGTKTKLKAYVQKGKRYTMSCSFSDSVLGSTLVYSDETVIAGLGTDTGYRKYTFTATRNDYIILRVRLSANQEFTISEIQIEQRRNSNKLRCTPKYNLPYLYTSTNAFYRRSKR